MHPVDRLLAYSDQYRTQTRFLASGMVLFIAFADWRIAPEVSLGFLYIIPILLTSGYLNGLQIVAVSAGCAVLREAFNPLHWGPGADLRVLFGSAGFAVAGYVVLELNRKRCTVLRHLEMLQGEIQLRQAAQQHIRIVIETSPLAILTLNSDGQVLLSNGSAQQLLGLENQPLEGSDIRPLLPILGRILKTQQSGDLRTTVECKVQRPDGEVFLAHIWLSTYMTADGLRLAAFIWDASENLRDKEGAGMDSMMATSRTVIGLMSHEIRNLASAAVAAYGELSLLPGVGEAKPLRALGSILQGMERIATSGQVLTARRTPAVAELGTVLDEARIVIDPGVRESGGSTTWRIAESLPLVQADHQGLLQVFLNLARNSQAAMTEVAEKELVVEAAAGHDLVTVRFRDSGCGVQCPADLFSPFQSGTRSAGLGLYVSRAILRAHDGDLRYEPQSRGSCFAVELRLHRNL
jgi:two-component system, LuxR family, sensor kinase FixL